MQNSRNQQFLSVRQMSRLLKRIELHENDVLLVKESKFKTEDVLEALRRGVEQLGIGTVYVIVVKDFEDIRSFNQQEMNAHGWYHVSQINKIARIHG
jgi:hypothetical protein